MTTKTQIVNLALHRLGTERINSLADNNKRAKIMNDLYDTTRRKLLRNHSWNFALKRAQLNKLVNKPAFGFEYEYSLPADYIKIWNIADASGVISNAHPGNLGFIPDKQQFVIEDGKLLTNLEQAYVLYGYDNTDTSQYTDTFIEAFALTLAAKACYSITQNNETTQLILGEVEKYLGESRSDSAQEYSSPDSYEISDFTAIRGY